MTMYKIGICDDDKILCSVLEEQIYELSKEIGIKVDIEVWYSGESIQNDMKKGIELEPISAENIREVLIRSIKQKSSADTYFEYQKGNSVFRVPVRNIAC